MKFEDIKALLDDRYEKYNTNAFIATDPIQLVHEFEKKQDIEIIGLLIATIAWGNRTSIIKNGSKLIQLMQGNPHNYVLNYSRDSTEYKFVHRTFNHHDLHFFLSSLSNIYKKHDSLEELFSEHPEYPGMKGRIIQFRTEFLNTPHEQRSEKHLSNPLKNSAAKRINMFLRWMVRSDKQGVDFGLWNTIPTSELMIPLDVHTGNIARKLNLLSRKQNDWKALEELMIKLREFDAQDPVKYDFALFGLGAFEKF